VRKTIGFRAWFYFRTGWATYFAFIFAAVNTLIVTYYLAIENFPPLKEVFPSFTHYIITPILLGIPILVVIGYVHFKRSAAFRTESDIRIESNPHMRRILLNTEAMVSSHIRLSELMIKMLKNEKLTEKELEKISQLQRQIKEHMKHRTVMGPI